MKSILAVAASHAATAPQFSMTDSVIKAVLYTSAMVLLLLGTLALHKRATRKLRSGQKKLAKGIEIVSRLHEPQQTLTVYKAGSTFLAVCTTPSGGIVAQTIRSSSELEAQLERPTDDEEGSMPLDFKSVLSHITQSRKG